jgi:Tol biopolymer transport system component
MFSPDGTRIALSSSRSGNNEIWVSNADGTQPLQLTSSGGRHAGSAQWSPDSHWIVYDAVTPSQTRDIFIVDATGGRPRPLVVHPAQDRVPSWSRDGKSIYFTSNRAGRDEIFRVPVSGGDPTQVTDQGGYVAFEAPDSATLYYTKTSSGPSPLFARPLAGGPERQVLDSVFNRSFVVAADGIYFIEVADDGRFSMKFLELASGKMRILTQIDGLPDLYLSISPDGQRALYTLREQTGADLMLIENFR